MTKLPWILTIVFAITTVVGWKKALAKDAKQQIQIETRKEIVKEIISQQDFESHTLSYDESVSSFAQDCLENPDVQSKIDKKAKLWAETISNQVLDNYKAEESRKEQQKVAKHMAAMEDFFGNAVNIYAEEYDIDFAVSEELHTIIEQGFEKQRSLYQRKVDGEISGREYKQLSNQTRKEGKLSVLDLLGPEGAKDFGAILQEEGEKARAEKEQMEEL